MRAARRSRWATPDGSACPTPVAQYRATADRPGLRSTFRARGVERAQARAYLSPVFRRLDRLASADPRRRATRRRSDCPGRGLLATLVTETGEIKRDESTRSLLSP